eukprot:g9621.t1
MAPHTSWNVEFFLDYAVAHVVNWLSGPPLVHEEPRLLQVFRNRPLVDSSPLLLCAASMGTVGSSFCLLHPPVIQWWPATSATQEQSERSASSFSLRSLGIGGNATSEAEEAWMHNSDDSEATHHWLACMLWAGCSSGIQRVWAWHSRFDWWRAGRRAKLGFAELYTLGNLLALVGTLFLAGPRRQLRRMGREKRWIASLCFVVSMVLTLLVALSPGKWHGRTLILLLLVLVQWAALIWYTLSYIPFGQRTALGALRACWSRCLGE